MPLIPPQPNSIASASEEALRVITALSVDTRISTDGEDVQTSAQKHNDEKQRLEIWIGEHDVESGKLDHRLREATILRDRVLFLLGELNVILAQDVSEDTNIAGTDENKRPSGAADIRIVTPAPLHPDLMYAEDSHSVESISLSLDTNVSVDTTATLPDSLPDSPVARVHDIISHLFELGPDLLDPTPLNRFDLSEHPDAAQHDISHVRARFPAADEGLIERLGRANWERRQSLRKVRTTLEAGPPRAQGTTLAWPVLEDAEINVSEPASNSDHSDEDANVESETSDVEATAPSSPPGTLSATTAPSEYPFSIKETQSTALTEPSRGISHANRDSQQKSVRYKILPPPFPNENFTGESFRCPLCAYHVSGIKSPSDWRTHVFSDLEPYMCTYGDCTLCAKTYGDRKQWWDHQTERHRAQYSWVCKPCEQKQGTSVFETSALFDDHIIKYHTYKLPTTQLQNIRDMCQRDTGRRPPPSTCPLCFETIVCSSKPTRKALERAVSKHVSSHLEQLAFFVAFPAGQLLLDEDDSQFQDDSDAGHNPQSEIASVVSKDTFWSKKDMQSANVEAFLADQQRAADSETSSAPPALRTVDSSSGISKSGVKGVSRTSSHGAMVPTFPLTVRMPAPNQHFYSRHLLLDGIDSSLRSPGRMCIIHGVGGVGKTLTANQYSHDHKHDYDAIFWLRAETAPSLAESYLQMVVALGIAVSPEDHHQVIAQGRNWLQKTDKRWLLVFDNALQWADISRYMPSALPRTKGSVLITTQVEALVQKTGNVTKIRTEPLDRQEGSAMLLRYLGRNAEDDPERHLAMEISAFVGGLPVAIAQLAGYAGYSQYPLEELIETFREWRRKNGVATDEADDLPATFREDSFSYDGALTMVWDVILREIYEDGRDVLNVLSYLNGANIPQSMIWGVHEDSSLHFLDTREKTRIRRTKESLVKRRLLLDTGESLAMHGSLQQALRNGLSGDSGKQQRVFNQAVALVREAFPQSNPLQQPSPDKWSEYQKLLPHLHTLHDAYHESNSRIKGSIDFAQLLLDAGMDQFEQGIIHEGLMLLNTAETVLDASSEPTFEAHQVMKADINAMIAILYDDTGVGKRQEALERRKLALEIRRTTFESANIKTRKDETLLFNSWMEYAISLLHYHRYEEAEPIIDKCLVKFREWELQEEKIPFEYAKYYNKIALVRMYQGRFDEAIRMAARGVTLMEKTGYSMFSSRFKFDMACIVLQSGDLDRALRIHEEIHNLRVETVGPTNQLSLHSMYAIGAIHELKADLYEAENWYRKVLDQRRIASSWPDEAFARTQFHLAKVLFAQGQAEDLETANRLQDSALEVLYRFLPLDHPSELADVTDEVILFDHLLPVSPGGPRFTGRGLLDRFMRTT